MIEIDELEANWLHRNEQSFREWAHNNVSGKKGFQPKGQSGPLPVPNQSDYAGGYDPNATFGRLTPNDKLYWVAASRDRLGAIRDNALVPGTLGNKMLIEMETGIPSTSPIYRGVRPSGTTGPYSLASYKPGATVDLKISSFTTSRDEALAYARNDAGRTGESSNRAFTKSTSALIVVEPGAATLDIGPTFRGNPGNEVLTAGRFRVVNVEMRETGIGLSGLEGQIVLTGTLPVITLRQTGVIDPQSGKLWDATDWIGTE